MNGAIVVGGATEGQRQAAKQTAPQRVPAALPGNTVTRSAGYLMVNSDPILWTMLNAIKEQQKEIAELKGQVQKLRTASHKRRR